MKTNDLRRANNLNIPMISGIWLVDLVKRYRHNIVWISCWSSIYFPHLNSKNMVYYFFCLSLLHFSAHMETPSSSSLLVVVLTSVITIWHATPFVTFKVTACRYERISVSMNFLISLYNRISLKHSENMRIHKINENTQMCLMFSGHMLTYIFNYACADPDTHFDCDVQVSG